MDTLIGDDNIAEVSIGHEVTQDVDRNFISQLFTTTTSQALSSGIEINTKSSKSLPPSTPTIGVTPTIRSTERTTKTQGTDKKNQEKRVNGKNTKRPFWMSIWQRPFTKSGLKKPKHQKIIFPDDSLLVEKIRKPYNYIYPNFKIKPPTPNNGVFWKQFYPQIQ